MSDQTKVDFVAKMLAAYLHGITDMEQVIKAIAEMKNLNHEIKEWMTEEHGEPDLNHIKAEDFEEFKKKLQMNHVPYHVLADGDNYIVITRGPKYAIDIKTGKYERELDPSTGTWRRKYAVDRNGLDIVGDRNIVKKIMDDIDHKHMQELGGYDTVEAIPNILSPEEAAERFGDQRTVFIENLNYMDARLLQRHADDLGIDTFLRMNPDDLKYSIEILENQFERNPNFPDKMSVGEQLMQDFYIASSMPAVESYHKTIDEYRTSIMDSLAKGYLGEFEVNSQTKKPQFDYITDLNHFNRAIIIGNHEISLKGFGLGDNPLDITTLPLETPKDLTSAAGLIEEQVGWDNMVITTADEFNLINFNPNNPEFVRQYKENRTDYIKSLNCAYEVSRGLQDYNMINLEIREKTIDEKNFEKAAYDGEVLNEGMQLVNQRIPNSDIIIEDTLSKHIAENYDDHISVLQFSEKYKKKMAEIEVAEAMEHVDVSVYTRRDLAELVMDMDKVKHAALENSAKEFIDGTLEKNPAYNPEIEPEITEMRTNEDITVHTFDMQAGNLVTPGFDATYGESIIDRDHNGIDDRIQGFVDYDGDSRDDRVEGEFSADYAAVDPKDFLAGVKEEDGSTFEIDHDDDMDHNFEFDMWS